MEPEQFWARDAKMERDEKLHEKQDRFLPKGIRRLTRKDILGDLASYYDEDVTKRALNSKVGCSYLTADGRMCGIGRLCDPGLLSEMPDGDVIALYEHQGGIEYFLRPEYHGQNVLFWEAVQSFHDVCINWDKNGLSEHGRNVLMRLHETWDEPPESCI